MANMYHPGGGFVDGCTAQEEELCRCSTLYHAIGENREISLNGLYKKAIPVGAVLYSPEVQFFRGKRSEGYPFFEIPRKFAVLGAAGYDLRNGIGQFFGDEVKNERDFWEKYREDTKRTIRNMLRTASAQGHEAVVLGAIGCGAFRGGVQGLPQLVASLYRDVLAEDEFVGVFKKIVFAVLDSPDGENITTFKNILQPSSEKKASSR